MSDVREPIQEDVVQAYIIANKLKCTLLLSTGIGKSKIAVDLTRKLTPDQIYIVVDSRHGRDHTWKRELIKFGLGSMLEHYVTIVTYAYQVRHLRRPGMLTENSLVFLDEVDYMGETPALAKILPIFEGIRTIGLTGFITEAKRPWFAENLPILFTFTAAQAQTKGFLNKLSFVFVKYNLSLEKDYEVKYKEKGYDKTFMDSENNVYAYQQAKIADCEMRKSIASRNYRDGEINRKTYQETLDMVEYKMRYAVKNRQDILLHSKSTATMARKLIKHIRSTAPNSKTIVFSKRTKQSELICGKDNVYNGAMTKAKALEAFNAFNRGETDLLGTCDKVNRNANIDHLDTAIFETFFGGDTSAVQRFGRMMRLDPDKVATCYVLLPYYLREDKHKEYTIQPTQQVTWAGEMIRSTIITNHVIWDYRPAIAAKS